MPAATLVTDRDEFRRRVAAATAGTHVPVYGSVVVEDPYRAYRRARGSEATGVYLETGGGDGWGYFGVDPDERVRIDAPASLWTPEDDSGGADDADTGLAGAPAASDAPTLWALDGLLAEHSIARGDDPVPHPCGYVGWLSYDVARELETLPDTTGDRRNLPRAVLHRYDGWAAWETGADPTRLYLTACPRAGAAPPETLYDRARDRIETLSAAATTGPVADPDPPVDASVTLDSACGRAAYRDRVERIQQAIGAGETFQANVAHRLTGPAAVHPVTAFDALRRVNPAPYSALIEDRACDLVSASPELLLEVTPPDPGDAAESETTTAARLTTEPIAGTRPRGVTDPVDRASEHDLRRDPKERAEHAMLVDLERNDLGAVSQFGSVEPSEYRRVDRYDSVMHLVSRVEGRARPGVGIADAIAATFPGGTITGAPKPRTMALIDRVERHRRGPYTGSIGIVGFDGAATLNIVIRTLVRQGDRYDCRVGAGIVADSDPDREYAETLAKGQALVDALRAAGSDAGATDSSSPGETDATESLSDETGASESLSDETGASESLPDGAGASESLPDGAGASESLPDGAGASTRESPPGDRQ